MALESHRFRGVVRDGKVELEMGAEVPDGASVIVLFEPESNAPAINTLGDLARSGLIGFWKDRDDLPSTNEEFIEWRKKIWSRKSA